MNRHTSDESGLVMMPGGWFVHESAYVDEGLRARIGTGTRLWHYCHVMAGAVIGEGCQLGLGCFVDRGAVLGDGCKLQNHVSVYAAVTLGNEVFCGPSCVFTNVVNPRAGYERKHELRPTVVGEGATIGANATIVCGIKIGRYAFVAAGAVVTHDVAAYELVQGVPARFRYHVSRAGHRLDWNFTLATSSGRSANTCLATCPETGEVYEKAGLERRAPVKLAPPPVGKGGDG